jgi:TonB-dependent starch-binding outer membrane protein SusC
MKKIISCPIDIDKIMKITLSQIMLLIAITGISFAKESKAQATLDKVISISVKDVSLQDA